MKMPLRSDSDSIPCQNQICQQTSHFYNSIIKYTSADPAKLNRQEITADDVKFDAYRRRIKKELKIWKAESHAVKTYLENPLSCDDK
jgi:hypothetical protein